MKPGKIAVKVAIKSSQQIDTGGARKSPEGQEMTIMEKLDGLMGNPSDQSVGRRADMGSAMDFII